VSPLTFLFAFLALYYKVNWQFETANVERMQEAKFKTFRDNQRYKRLLKSKKHRPEVIDLEIEAE